jgi:hypothetical protein
MIVYDVQPTVQKLSGAVHQTLSNIIRSPLEKKETSCQLVLDRSGPIAFPPMLSHQLLNKNDWRFRSAIGVSYFSLSLPIHRSDIMQVNANTPAKGLVANIEREKQFMNGVWCRVCGFNLPQAHAKEAIDEHDHDQRRHADLLQRLGQRAAPGF